jgi:hypothetical protein
VYVQRINSKIVGEIIAQVLCPQFFISKICYFREKQIRGMDLFLHELWRKAKLGILLQELDIVSGHMSAIILNWLKYSNPIK